MAMDCGYGSTSKIRVGRPGCWVPGLVHPARVGLRGDLVRFREDRPVDLARTRCAVKAWRERHPQGNTNQLLADLGGRFHPDYGVVLRVVLFAADRHQTREITGVTAGAVR